MSKLTDKVKLLQKVAVVHKGEILILKRSDESKYRPGNWDLPGGNSEWPEGAEGDLVQPHLDDVLREVAEETGLDLEELGLKDQIAQTKPIYFSTYFEQDKQLFTVIVGWQINLPADFNRDLVKISPEHTENVWIKPEQFDEFDFGFAGQKDGFIRGMIAR
jgi:8-oxo-dGTP pyrophosphatase MutT (NUDIX family)